MNYFAANLHYLLKKGETDLVQALSFSGDYFQDLANGDVEPSVSELVELADAFGIFIDDLIRVDLEQQAEMLAAHEIHLLVLDVDGVLTDGGMFFAESGDELKRFDTKDGRAIINLQRSGTLVAFLSSGSKLTAIQDRAKRLGVKLLYVGAEPKEEILGNWLEELGLAWENVAFIGDDVNDRIVLGRVGLSACPADAVDLIQREVDVVLNKKGGHGAVREFVERYLLKIE